MNKGKECIGLVAGHSGDSLTDKLHEIGFSVALVCGRNDEPGTDHADYILIEDLSNHKKIIDFFNEHKVNYIIVGTGHIKAIELAGKLKCSDFITNIDFCKSMLAKDKVKFKKKLLENGINTPRFFSFWEKFEINEVVDKIGLPCVVKSATDAVQPRKVNNFQELLEGIDKIKETKTEILIEEYISGNDCTVAVENDGNISKGLGVTYYSKAKEYKLKGFETAYSKKLSFKKEKEIITIAEKVTRLLEFSGLVRIDFIVDEINGKVYVLELNSIIVTGYAGSAYPFFRNQGIDIAKVMIDNAMKTYKTKANKR